MGFAHIVWHTAVATLSGNPYQNWLCTIHQANEPFLNLPLLFHILALLCHKNPPTFYFFLVAQIKLQFWSFQDLFLCHKSSNWSLVTFIIFKTSISISSFQCPEPNGLFADPEQCDLYYICEDNVAQPELCEDGLLFDDSNRNRETCKLPHGVDCGKREFVQEPQAGIDARCPRYLNHPKIFCGIKFLGITIWLSLV